jgi:hypothetical protein
VHDPCDRVLGGMGVSRSRRVHGRVVDIYFGKVEGAKVRVLDCEQKEAGGLREGRSRRLFKRKCARMRNPTEEE